MKFVDKIYAVTANAALKAATVAAGHASLAGSYQPKEPKELTEYVKQQKN